MSELKGLIFSRVSSAGELFPLIGRELRDLFAVRITRDLSLLGVHLYCRRCPQRADALRADLAQSLAFFLDCYIPLIIAANLLCSVEEDWTSDLKLLWQDLEQLMAARISNLHRQQVDTGTPPTAIDRIKSLDHEDPIGTIMLTEFEAIFPRVLKEQSNRFITS